MANLSRDRLRAGLRRRNPILALLSLIALTAIGVGLIGTTGANAEVAPISTPPPTSSSPAPNTSPFPPTAPTNLTAVAHSTTVTLNWTASTGRSSPVTGYRIIYGESFNDQLYVKEVGTVTTVTINVLPTRQYHFSVDAVDALGHHSPSAQIIVVTPASDTAADQTPPSAPANLTAGPLTDAFVDLNWSGSTDNVGVTGYNVYYFDGLVASSLVATVTGTSYSMLLDSQRHGRNIFFVRARDAAGNVSIASNTVEINNPGGWTSSPPPSRTASPTQSPPASVSCKVTFTNSSVWHGGFVANIVIANTGTAPIAGWDVTFTFGGDQRISSGWNLTFSQTGKSVTLHNADWNQTIGAGRTVSAGIQGTWTTSSAAPTSFALNGVPCAVG